MRAAQFNYFDWTLVTIVGISMVMAFHRGLVRAIFALLGFIGGFQMATWFYTDVGEWVLSCRIRMSVQTARIVAFLLIVIVVALVVDQAGRLLQTAAPHGWPWILRSTARIGIRVRARLLDINGCSDDYNHCCSPVWSGHKFSADTLFICRRA